MQGADGQLELPTISGSAIRDLVGEIRAIAQSPAHRVSALLEIARWKRCYGRNAISDSRNRARLMICKEEHAFLKRAIFHTPVTRAGAVMFTAIGF
jgi:hypothetical protein